MFEFKHGEYLYSCIPSSKESFFFAMVGKAREAIQAWGRKGKKRREKTTRICTRTDKHDRNKSLPVFYYFKIQIRENEGVRRACLREGGGTLFCIIECNIKIFPGKTGAGQHYIIFPTRREGLPPPPPRRESLFTCFFFPLLLLTRRLIDARGRLYRFLPSHHQWP